jgi:hypothetical protein
VYRAIFEIMTLRRSLGMLTLLAMMHFIIVSTAAACIALHGDAAAGSPEHAGCAPSTSHSRGGTTDRTTELPCCAAIASCSAAPLVARTIPVALIPPVVTLASATSERAPRADVPAPELPPPKA